MENSARRQNCKELYQMNFHTIIGTDDDEWFEYTEPIELVRDIERKKLNPTEFANEDYVNDIIKYIWDCIEKGIISDPSLKEIFDCFFGLTDFLFTQTSVSELLNFDVSSGIAKVREVYLNPYTENYWAIDMEETSLGSEMIEPYKFYHVIPYTKAVDSWRPF